MAEETAKPAPPSGERVSICAGRYEVFAGNPLPHLDSPGTRAYAAQGTRGNAGILALVLQPSEFARLDVAAEAAKVNNPSVLRYLEHDVVYWSAHGRHVPVLLYEKPSGPRLMQSLAEERPALNNELHFRQMVESLAEALRDIYLAGANHGRINPTNMFLRDAASGVIQLGDYLTALPGKYQNAAFCTIEQTMALAAGRGPCSATDDIYAAGASLLTIVLGKQPLAQMKAEDIVQLKIEKGSLMALAGGLRIPSAYSELLRGMLADDPVQRWALDDINHWLAGRRLGSKPAAQVPKAQRGFEIAGQAYSNVRLLARAITQNPDASARALEDGTLDRWLRRSLGDEARAERVAEAIASSTATQRGGSPTERAVARAAISLDPAAPIRFRDIAALPEGLGNLLADQMVQGQSPRNIADLIAAQFVIHWAHSQPAVDADVTGLLQTYEAQRVLLDRTHHGFGIERVLYELNPTIPCLSPMVSQYHPLSLKAVTQAIEIHASTVPADDTRSEPMDRHLAAFVLARHRRINDRLFPFLAPNSDAGQRAISILYILAELQRKFNPEPMPKTAEWMARLLMPGLERFHNRSLRDRMQRDLRKLGKRGQLDEMFALMDDGNTRKQDNEGFDIAHNEWLRLENMARQLSGNAEGRDRALLIQGRQITAFVSALTATIAIVVTVFLRLM
jgi:hypothetical protein